MKNISPKAKQVEKKCVKPSGKNLGKFFCYIHVELCNRVISHIQRKNSPNFITVWSVEEPEDERFPTPLSMVPVQPAIEGKFVQIMISYC